MLDKFADEIKQIRISRDLTLQQVAVKTRIDYKFLQAIEVGDFEFLPELYVKAFLKEYLRAIGVDEQLYMKKYEAARTGSEYIENQEIPESPVIKEIPEAKQETAKPQKKLSSFDAIRNFKHQEERSSMSKKKKQKMLTIFSLGTLFFITLLYILFYNSGDEIIVPEKSWDEIVEDTQERYTPENPAATATDYEQVNADSLKLTIKATDTSWIRIEFDDSRTEEFILFPRSEKSMKTSNNYKLVIGNSAGIQLELNGKALAFKSKGSVQRLQIDSSGVKEIEQKTVAE
jgi:cytoskeletal protein RodZ